MPQKQQPIDDWQDVGVDDWQDVDDWEDITPQKGYLQQWDEAWFNKPLSHLVTGGPMGGKVSQYIDPIEGRREDQWKIPELDIPFFDLPESMQKFNPSGGTWRSLMGGLGEGATTTAEGFTSPLNLATAGTASRATSAAKTASILANAGKTANAAKALKTANRATTATKALSAPMVASGAARMERGFAGGEDREGDTDWADVLFGGVEAIGGAGAAAMPRPPRLEQIANARTTPPPAVTGDLPLNVDPNFNQGMGDPMLAGSTPYPPGQPLPTKVSLKQPTPAKVEMLRKQGYVSGGVDENGYPQMIRKDVLDKIEAPPMRPEPESSSIFGDNEINFDEEITIKNPSITAIKKLQDQGFVLAEVDGNIAIFRPISEQEMRVPAEGSGGSLVERMKRSEELLKQKQPFEMQEPTALPEAPPDQLLPHEFAPDQLQIDEPVMGGYSPKFVPRRGALETIGNVSEQEMRVPGWKEGNTGLENVAMGGADPRVLDVLGSSLYSRERPIVTMKELLQNAFDEHKELGIREPIRVLIDQSTTLPGGGEPGKSITVRDRGRGLQPEQIYTVLTDMGKTGKAGVESAAGGFGFAKAAPFLGGKHARITSVIDTPEGRVRYTFEGNPSEFKNQARGVALNEEAVGPEVPTGLEITTFYDENMSGFYDVADWAKNMTERSPSVESGIKLVETYGANNDQARAWLDEDLTNPIKPEDYNYIAGKATSHQAEPVPTLMDSLEVPGAKVNVHYDIPPGMEASEYNLHMMNKGMYQGSQQGSYGGEQVANVPRSIVADIIATVEEGHENYPFSANREQISAKVSGAIKNWISENIVTGVMKKRVAAIQKKYDRIDLLNENAPNDVHFYDDGNRFTPEEIELINSSPAFTNATTQLELVHRNILAVADELGWTPQDYSGNSTWKVPSERLKKFGLLVQGPDAKGTTLGIHIPRPDDMNNSAILINLFEHLNDALRKNPDAPIDNLTTALMTTIVHEQAHIPGGGHDKGHSYRDADLHSRLGEADTVDLLAQLGKAFDDGSGRISPEISEILSIYNESRERPASGDASLLKTGISSQRQPNTPGGTPRNARGANAGRDEPSLARELYELPRGLTTTADVSFGFRQGLPLITTANWWKSWIPAMKAIGSEEAYKGVMQGIESDPIMQRRVDTTTGKLKPSFAQEAGVAFTDLSKKLSNREDNMRSTMAERLPLGIGRVIKASNRGYNAYLNHLRFSTFKSLVDNARDMSLEAAETGSARPGFLKQDFTKEQAKDLNPYRNIVLAKQLADFVNTASGRGPLRLDLPHLTKEKGLHWKERSLEQSAEALTNVLFSPRLFARNVRMLNPGTYIMAQPMVRRQYVKALLSTAGAWSTVAGLASLAGAEVSLDPDSSDFGKIKIGNTRLDPAGGMQQFLVAAHRMLNGKYVSSASGEEFNLGEGYKADTGKDVGERFMVNKLHPVAKFAWDLWDASEYKPVHVADRIAQMFIPLIIQDVYELAQEDPMLLPLILPVGAGMGTQTYEAGEVEGRLIPPEYDYQYQGGGLREFKDSISSYLPW